MSSYNKNDTREKRICLLTCYLCGYYTAALWGTETVQVTPLRRTLASSP